MSDVVSVKNAAKTFRRGVEEVKAIDDVSVDIPEGEYLAVVGPSGSGKTTLLNLIGCVDRPTDGTVMVRGMQTDELTDRALATIRSTTIGFVFQHFFLVPTLTAVENVMLPEWFCARHNGDAGTRARKLLKDVGLESRADHYPSELSGGEMQRVALARALINDPEILLADEPTGNLDTKSAREISRILKELNDSGLTVVIVTHNPELESFATRSIHLRDGRIAEERRLRPIPERVRVLTPEPVSEADRESEQPALTRDAVAAEGEVHESQAVPEYMPASMIKRTWGSWRVAGLMVVLGALMASTAAMRFVGALTGIGVLRQSPFVLAIYRGNEITRAYAGTPARIFSGFWPIFLGVLAIAAGVTYFLKKQRIAGWSSIAVGALATMVALVNVIMSYAYLGRDPAANFPGMAPAAGAWVFLATGIATLAVGLAIVLRRRLGRTASQPAH
jgi:putative ABC transport system ATP-binding protein